MTVSFFPTTRRWIWLILLPVIIIGLVGCAQATSSPVPAASPTKTAMAKTRQVLGGDLKSASAVHTDVTASPTPTNIPTTVPVTLPKTANPTRGVPTSTPSPAPTATQPPQVAIQPAAEAGSPADAQPPTSGQPSAALPPLSVSPTYQELPAGSSVMFRINADPSCAHHYAFQTQGLPNGITAEFLGDATPCRDTLVLTTAVVLAPGSYTVQVLATQIDTAQSSSAQITLNVTNCSEFQGGTFTQAVQSNLVTLITAGKPAIEHGLLVPIQVCQERALWVTLTSAISEAGTPMAAPPRFYLYRSMVWPAPSTITAHSWGRNVSLPRIDSHDWQLGTNITPGLYLLVFERDRFTIPTISDPASFPASVTYLME